jgi:hypothetical protein
MFQSPELLQQRIEMSCFCYTKIICDQPQQVKDHIKYIYSEKRIHAAVLINSD